MFYRQCVLTVGREILNICKQTKAVTCREFHSVSKRRINVIVSGVRSQTPYRVEATHSNSDYDYEREIEEMSRKRAREINAGEAMKKQNRTKQIVILGTCFLVFFSGHLVASMFVFQRKKQIHNMGIATNYRSLPDNADASVK